MIPTYQGTIVVSLGEIRVTNDPSAVLTCLGLGSCVGLCAYDAVAKVGGAAHIVLPSSEGRDMVSSSKFADVAVPLLIKEMCSLGALEYRLIIKIAGGAQMSVAPGGASLFKIGENNVEATETALSKHGLRVANADVGGHHGRSLRLYVDSGRITVTAGGSERREL